MKTSRNHARRSRIAVAAGLALFSIAIAGPVAMYMLPDAANAAAEVSASGDALSDLENRSPGARLYGLATKAKRNIARLLPGRDGDGDTAPEPEQRALGKVFDPPVADDFTFAPLTDDEPVAALAGPEEAEPTSFAPPVGGNVPSGPGGFIPPGGGSSGGGSSGGNPPTGAVPEPDTWALLILGFGAVGGAMRRRNRKVAISIQA